MYLVHVALRGRSGAELPADARDVVLAHALPQDGVEHVVIHPHAVPCPVVGVYLLADRLETAEFRAERVCRRALASPSALDGWELVNAQVPLMDVYERMPLPGTLLD
ncbi:hypothetical protein [Streptomyces griseocarneus]|uniref:hypothetical protein n=1 Tax=Streptomyces griseocarneus TaxID=51201 RepID=UPI00167DA13E|nr:hypothetical protein [Streptomyces griseocarneus]MBZ6472146.1 hypothetical protein [Streptomyces griseocarneus]GHG73609.1 hypothetical protein GCM10018779_49920 [Streptomyces griseocarneus]